MKSGYVPGRVVSGVPRTLWTYLGGAAAARAGDEMSAPAVLLLGLAVAGRPATGSELLAAVIIAAAVGGPVFWSAKGPVTVCPGGNFEFRNFRLGNASDPRPTG